MYLHMRCSHTHPPVQAAACRHTALTELYVSDPHVLAAVADVASQSRPEPSSTMGEEIQMALWLRSQHEWKEQQTIHWAGSRMCYDYYFL